MISEKQKTTCKTLNYIEHLLILASTIVGCISVCSFVSAVGTPVEITSSEVWLKTCGVTAGIKNHKSLVKKKKAR